MSEGSYSLTSEEDEPETAEVNEMERRFTVRKWTFARGDYEGFETRMSVALREENHRMVEMLLKSGVDPNAPCCGDDQGYFEVPLVLAARMNNAMGLRLLLSGGASVFACNSKGSTADKEIAQQDSPAAEVLFAFLRPLEVCHATAFCMKQCGMVDIIWPFSDMLKSISLSSWGELYRTSIRGTISGSSLLCSDSEGLSIEEEGEVLAL